MTTMTAERLTVGEVGRLLGVGPQRVRDLCNAGRLPVERTATGIRLIPRVAVEKLAKERSVGRTAASR